MNLYFRANFEIAEYAVFFSQSKISLSSQQTPLNLECQFFMIQCTSCSQTLLVMQLLSF